MNRDLKVFMTDLARRLRSLPNLPIPTHTLAEAIERTTVGNQPIDGHSNERAKTRRKKRPCGAIPAGDCHDAFDKDGRSCDASAKR